MTFFARMAFKIPAQTFFAHILKTWNLMTFFVLLSNTSNAQACYFKFLCHFVCSFSKIYDFFPDHFQIFMTIFLINFNANFFNPSSSFKPNFWSLLIMCPVFWVISNFGRNSFWLCAFSICMPIVFPFFSTFVCPPIFTPFCSNLGFMSIFPDPFHTVIPIFSTNSSIQFYAGFFQLCLFHPNCAQQFHMVMLFHLDQFPIFMPILFRHSKCLCRFSWSISNFLSNFGAI